MNTCKISPKRVLYMAIGLVVLALGIAMFRLARLGNDPFTGMCFAISDRYGISLGVLEMGVNALLFVLMLLTMRSYIGVGTFLNAFLVGYVVEFFAHLLESIWAPESLPVRLIICFMALVVTGLGCSLYMSADMGISPYDAAAKGLADRLPVRFFFCRIFTDALCVLVCWWQGGILGVGIILSAFCLGPFISLFDTYVSGPLYKNC